MFHWRGLIKLVVTFICWIPVMWYWCPQFFFPAEWKKEAWENPVVIALTPVKNHFAAALAWILLPWAWRKAGWDVEGEIIEHVIEDETGDHYHPIDVDLPAKHQGFVEKEMTGNAKE